MFIFFGSAFYLSIIVFDYLISKRKYPTQFSNLLAILLPIMTLSFILIKVVSFFNSETKFTINRGVPTLIPNSVMIGEKLTKRPVTKITANEFGFRDVSWKKRAKHIEKKKHWRVVLLGDSVVFGTGVPNQKNILARVLEKKLNANNFTNKDFYVYSLAQMGLNTKMEAAMLRGWISEITPDLVILYHNQNNDLMPKFPYYRNHFFFLAFPLSAISYFNALDRYPKKFSSTKGVLEKYNDSIEQIHSTIKKYQAKIIVNYLHKYCPLFFHHIPNNSREEMAFAYLGDWDEEKNLTFENDFHPTEKGVRWMANKTYSQLKKVFIRNKVTVLDIQKEFDDECVMNDKFKKK